MEAAVASDMFEHHERHAVVRWWIAGPVGADQGLGIETVQIGGIACRKIVVRGDAVVDHDPDAVDPLFDPVRMGDQATIVDQWPPVAEIEMAARLERGLPDPLQRARAEQRPQIVTRPDITQRRVLRQPVQSEIVLVQLLRRNGGQARRPALAAPDAPCGVAQHLDAERRLAWFRDSGHDGPRIGDRVRNRYRQSFEQALQFQQQAPEVDARAAADALEHLDDTIAKRHAADREAQVGLQFGAERLDARELQMFEQARQLGLPEIIPEPGPALAGFATDTHPHLDQILPGIPCDHDALAAPDIELLRHPEQRQTLLREFTGVIRVRPECDGFRVAERNLHPLAIRASDLLRRATTRVHPVHRETRRRLVLAQAGKDHRHVQCLVLRSRHAALQSPVRGSEAGQTGAAPSRGPPRIRGAGMKGRLAPMVRRAYEAAHLDAVAGFT